MVNGTDTVSRQLLLEISGWILLDNGIRYNFEDGDCLMRSIDWLKESYLVGRFNLETYRRLLSDLKEDLLGTVAEIDLLSADPHGEQRMHKAWLTEVSSGLYTLCLRRKFSTDEANALDETPNHIIGLFTDDELRLIKDVLNTKF